MVGRAEVVAVRPELDADWTGVNAAFPIKITRSFFDRMDPADPNDPLALQVFPDPRELVVDGEDLLDPVGDAAKSPVPWVVHKYPDRILLLMTKRCHLHCRYCFRRDHSPGGDDPTPSAWQAALDYVARSAPREVILSGGDPLVVPVQRLLDTIDALRPVRTIRIHTRAPITFPEVVRPELIEGLRSRAGVWVVVHCNHPAELSADVDRALADLVAAGIPVLNQAVLLRGVNDRVEVLEELFEGLVARRVMPYYLHVTDHARGNAHLRVPMAEAARLHAALGRRIGGTALPRLVVDPPDGSGKRNVREMLASDG